MKLYSGPLSIFSAKVRIALGEKGIEHELIQVGWSRKSAYAPHHPEVLRLNPKGQVPVLVDGDVVVCDSTLIVEYLEERVPTPHLLPREVGARARCRQLEAAADEIWFPHLWKLIEARVYGVASGETADAAIRDLHEIYRGFDKSLDGRDTASGDVSVADIACFVVSHTAAVLGAPIPKELPGMVAWHARMGSRPAVRAVIDDMSAFAARALAP